MSSNSSPQSSRASSLHLSEFESALNSSSDTLKGFVTDDESRKNPLPILTPQYANSGNTPGTSTRSRPSVTGSNTNQTRKESVDERRNSFIRLHQGPTPQEDEFLRNFFQSLLEEKLNSQKKERKAENVLTVAEENVNVAGKKIKELVSDHQTYSRAASDESDSLCTSEKPSTSHPNILLSTSPSSTLHSLSSMDSEFSLAMYRNNPKDFFIHHLTKFLSVYPLPHDAVLVATSFAHQMTEYYRHTDEVRFACFEHLSHVDITKYTSALWFLAQSYHTTHYGLFENTFIRGGMFQEAVDTCSRCQIED